jgi:hypothetical protein
MKVKINQIKLTGSDMYTSNNYPHSGMFIVDQIDIVDPNMQIVFANKQTNIVVFICMNYELGEIDHEQKQEKEQDGVSQEIFFKTISMLANKESYKE